MSEELAQASYQKIYQYWEENWKDNKKYPLPEPLTFILPENLKKGIGGLGFFGVPYIDEKKHYYQCEGNASDKLDGYSWVIMIFVASWAFVTLINPFFNNFFYNWLPALGGLSLYYLFKYLSKIITRKPCCVFDRENSLFYFYQGKNKPHLALNFYDQYYYITIGAIGALDYAHLWMKPRIKREDGTFDDSMRPRVILPTGNRKMAMAAWFSLLTYMNKEQPFTEKEYKVFTDVQERKKKMGFKVEGIHFPDGTIEKF